MMLHQCGSSENPRPDAETTERRSGVVLSVEQLRELQEALFAVLCDVVGLCEKNGIRCFLVGGTALGAMRHRGFIPWDDDADVAVFRKDYPRFLTALREAYPSRYEVQGPECTPGYPSLITRVRLRGTEAVSREDLWTNHGGVALDVFVIENVFDFAPLRWFQGMMSLCFTGMLACRKSFLIRRQMAHYRVPGSGRAAKDAVRRFVGGVFAWLPVGFFRKIALFFNRMCRNGASRRVSIPSGRLLFFGDMYRREIFADGRAAEFAGRSCTVPAGVEDYLERCYGDWRKIPENISGGTHFLCRFAIDNWRERFDVGGDADLRRVE